MQQELLKVEKQEKFNLDAAVFDLVDALRSPVLTHAQAWSDCIPDRVLKIIPLARMKSLAMKEQFASYPEVAVFIMTRTLEAPMTSEWTDIYTHVTCQMCQEYFGEDHWEAVSAKKELDDYTNRYVLMPLRKFIWEKRRKYLKERMKSEKVDKSIREFVSDDLQDTVDIEVAAENIKTVTSNIRPTVVQGELFSF